MASTVWKGSLTFGLVSIPIRLVRAARAARVPLKQLYRARRTETTENYRTNPPDAPSFERDEEDVVPASEMPEVAPVRRTYQPVNDPEPERPLEQSELVKGYEYAKGQYVVVDEQELRSIAPTTSTELPIVDFVRFSEIDPVYLETSYYVTPNEAGEKAYALLFEAMRASGFAAIGHLTMHRRDHVIIVRNGKTGLIAHTMFYPEEVRSIEEFRTDVSIAGGKELELAGKLIDALAGPFEPAKFKNQFQERLQQLIDAKLAGNKVVAEAPAAARAPVIDIMEALRKSLQQVPRKAAGVEEKAKKTARRARHA